MDDKNNEKPQDAVTSPEAEKELPKIGVELSKVASNPKKSLIIIIVGILATIYLIHNMLKDDDQKVKKNQVEKVAIPNIVVKPAVDIDSAQGPVLPTLPKAPALQDPAAPKPVAPSIDKAPLQPPVAPPLVAKSPSSPVTSSLENVPMPNSEPLKIAKSEQSIISTIPKAAEDPETKKRRETRKKSTIMLISGTPAKSQEQIDQDAAFKPRSNLEYLLSRGKVIDAVIETAINTDFASEIRAVISRDVFSESGKIVLIPKGSRVFGSFTSSVDALYGRVNIVWERVDLPTGYTLTFAGTGVDELGRKGTQGRLDTKIKEKIGNSVLSTALNVAFASALDKMVKPQQNSQQATQAQGQATSLQQAVQASYNAVGTDAQKIASMCAAARSSVDATSVMYQQIQSACSGIVPVGGTPATAASIYAALMGTANTGLTSSAVASTPTKAQQATEKGMQDFSKVITDIVEQSQPKPTVTIDQGTHIKIYVNKDYKFPKVAVNKSRFL